jgi:hypothetical protein
VDISGKAVEAYLKGEYNRSFGCYGDLSVIGELELIDIYTFRGGFLYGGSAGVKDIKTFARANAAFFSEIPLVFSISWIYNGLPDYETHVHTVLPFVSFSARQAGISIGTNFRFPSFFNEPAIFESVVAFSAYFHFYVIETIRVGIVFGNFCEFYAGNIGAYSLKLNAAVRINNDWSIHNEVKLAQSGGDGLSSIFYGIAWQGGVRYSW